MTLNTIPTRWLNPVALSWLILLGFETLCQVSLKLAGEQSGAFEFTFAAALNAAHSPWLWSAAGCYLGAFLAWMVILRKSSLSSAFPTSAIVFVAVMGASFLIVGESLNWSKLLGSAVIVCGILMLGSDTPKRADH